MDDMDVLAKGFPWSASQFLEGDVANLKLLAGFEREFAELACTEPPFWWGLDIALQDADCLRAGLDIGIAYIKNYELDRADAVYKYSLPAARNRGMPWNMKCMQDCATLRMKQNRQMDAIVLLEEI